LIQLVDIFALDVANINCFSCMIRSLYFNLNEPFDKHISIFIN
jgi:hypothetical protein